MHNTTSCFYFEHAVDVYKREDYKTAYKLFLPLAEQGDAKAQELLDLIVREINMKRTERITRVPRTLGHETI